MASPTAPEQVGRNYMRHNQSVLMALLESTRNDTDLPEDPRGQRLLLQAPTTATIRLGLIQMCAATHPDQIKAEALPPWLAFLPEHAVRGRWRGYSMDFWLSSEDLPRPENRITMAPDGKVSLLEIETNREAHKRLRAKMEQAMTKLGAMRRCSTTAPSLKRTSC